MEGVWTDKLVTLLGHEESDMVLPISCLQHQNSSFVRHCKLGIPLHKQPHLFHKTMHNATINYDNSVQSIMKSSLFPFVQICICAFFIMFCSKHDFPYDPAFCIHHYIAHTSKLHARNPPNVSEYTSKHCWSHRAFRTLQYKLQSAENHILLI
jgi:hypothetical protein